MQDDGPCFPIVLSEGEKGGIVRFAVDLDSSEMYVIQWLADGSCLLFSERLTSSGVGKIAVCRCEPVEFGQMPRDIVTFCLATPECFSCRNAKRTCRCPRSPVEPIPSWKAFADLLHALGNSNVASSLSFMPSEGCALGSKRLKVFTDSVDERRALSSRLGKVYKLLKDQALQRNSDHDTGGRSSWIQMSSRSIRLGRPGGSAIAKNAQSEPMQRSILRIRSKKQRKHPLVRWIIGQSL